MSDEKDFSDANPFLALDRSRFRDASGAEKKDSRRAPDRRSRPAASGAAARDASSTGSDDASDDADSRLFLEAVGPAARPKDQKTPERRPAFRLGEHATFRQIRGDDGSGGTRRKPAAEVSGPSRSSRASRSFAASPGDGPAASPASAAPARRASNAPPAPRRPTEISAIAQENAVFGSVTPSEEDAAFNRAMRDVAPLGGKGRAVAPETPPPVPPAHVEMSLQDFMDGKLEFALSLTGEYLEGHVVGLDETTMNKLRAGQYSPEAHLDLHGLNAVQAFQALLGFFRSAWHKGLRTVLVVPGRGRNSPDGIGILRDKLQFWLTEEPFKRVVLAFCTARPADGGAGSVYILLRKYRKKGKIYWERTPADPDLF